MSTTTEDSSSWYYEGEEHPKLYKPGGYHDVSLGDLYKDRYRVVYKLGWGCFSTVWAAYDYDNKGFVALKIHQSSNESTEIALDEIEIHKTVDSNLILDTFRITGENGIHTVCVYQILGPSLYTILNKRDRLDLTEVKYIVKTVKSTLDKLHSHNIIHTDIKLDNILLNRWSNTITKILNSYTIPKREDKICIEYEKIDIPFEDDYKTNDFKDVSLIDFGLARVIDKENQEDDIQPKGYMAPEVILGCPYDCKVDIWNLGCLAYELLTGHSLFNHVKGYYEYILADIVELLGPIPNHMLESGTLTSEYLYPDGTFKDIEHLNRYNNLTKKLLECDLWTHSEIKEIEKFLRPMLEPDYTNRKIIV